MGKKCTDCGERKSLKDFPLRGRGRGNTDRQSYCGACAGVRRRGRNLLHRYGITSEDYDRMYAEQKGRCGICGVHQCETGNRFAVDHCHDTGVVRGLLCFKCNTAIGRLNDDPDLLRRQHHG